MSFDDQQLETGRGASSTIIPNEPVILSTIEIARYNRENVDNTSFLWLIHAVVNYTLIKILNITKISMPHE